MFRGSSPSMRTPTSRAGATCQLEVALISVALLYALRRAALRAPAAGHYGPRIGACDAALRDRPCPAAAEKFSWLQCPVSARISVEVLRAAFRRAAIGKGFVCPQVC